MKTMIPVAFLSLVLVIGGCIHNYYRVEITPDGDGFQRELTCWRSEGEKDSELQPFDQQEIEKIRPLYQGHETTDGGKKHKFSGRFTNQTPADVGGAGSYTRFVSPLGTLTCYVERFRGNDDLRGELARRNAAADRLVDLLQGWLASKLGQEPGFDNLRRFLDKDFRRDVKNLILYAWSGNLASEYLAESEGEFLVRAGQYLCERGYAKPEEVPGLRGPACSATRRPSCGTSSGCWRGNWGSPMTSRSPGHWTFSAMPQASRPPGTRTSKGPISSGSASNSGNNSTRPTRTQQRRRRPT